MNRYELHKAKIIEAWNRVVESYDAKNTCNNSLCHIDDVLSGLDIQPEDTMLYLKDDLMYSMYDQLACLLYDCDVDLDRDRRANLEPAVFELAKDVLFNL